MTSQAGFEAFDDNLFIRVDGCQAERQGDCTVRPVGDPEPQEEGTGHFEPLRLTHNEPIYLQGPQSPDSPIELFQRFLPDYIVEQWARWTNESPWSGPEGPVGPRSRKLDWKPTTKAEIWLFVAYLIYLGQHNESRRCDYWELPKVGQQGPTHTITKYMSRNRFQALSAAIRIHDTNQPLATGLPKPYAICDSWSKHIQTASRALYTIGTDLAVDECMVGFTGRSQQTTTVPNKPTPTGFKIWVIAQRGYCLGWLWHTPGCRYGPVGLINAGRKRKRGSGERGLNNTQAAVAHLLTTLPRGNYHVFLDNLFTSADLLRHLRIRGHGATGTCRLNCGINEVLVAAKKADGGKDQHSWGWIEAIATSDHKVCAFLTSFLPS